MTLVDDVYVDLERAFTKKCAREEGLLPGRQQCDVLRFAAELIVERMTAGGIEERIIRDVFCVTAAPLRSFRVSRISAFNWTIEVQLADAHWWTIAGDTFTSMENAQNGLREIAKRLGLGESYHLAPPGNYQSYAGKTFGYITLSKLSMDWNTPPSEPVS
jgi:hypothetical protein